MKTRTLVVATVASAAIAAALLTSSASGVTPSQDACHTTTNSLPSGNCGSFTQAFKENFNGDSIPLGKFSDCDHNPDSKSAYCGGLSTADRANWWAYPSGWEDTAKSGADGNTGAPFGGNYDPAKTVWVGPLNSGSTDGVLHVESYRPSAGGDNHVAAVVPKKCMDQKYGKYSERFKVTTNTKGFKSAHLFYAGGQEVDFPEGDWTDRISGYVHPQETSVNTSAKWTSWHTTSIEWVPGKVRLYLDGKLIKTSATALPKGSWILQNESSIEGPYAAPGAKAELVTTWVTCYKYTP